MSSITEGYMPCDEAFFECGAKELAVKMLGKYLFCHESEILVRIVETEAYPDGMLQKCIAQLLTKTPNLRAVLYIADDHPFPDKAGVVVRVGEALFRRNPGLVKPRRGNYLYVTAGGEGDARGVVLIRSCAPHVRIPFDAGIEELPAYMTTILHRLGMKKLPIDRRRLLVDPVPVAKAVGRDWESNPNLSEEGGVQLLYEKLVARPLPQPDSDPDSDAEAEPDSDPNAETDSDPDAEPDAEPVAEPEAEPETESRWEVRRLEAILHGPRAAPKAVYVRRSMYGRDPNVAAQLLKEKLRFALDCRGRYPFYADYLLEPMDEGNS